MSFLMNILILEGLLFATITSTGDLEYLPYDGKSDYNNFDHGLENMGFKPLVDRNQAESRIIKCASSEDRFLCNGNIMRDWVYTRNPLNPPDVLYSQIPDLSECDCVNKEKWLSENQHCPLSTPLGNHVAVKGNLYLKKDAFAHEICYHNLTIKTLVECRNGRKVASEGNRCATRRGTRAFCQNKDLPVFVVTQQFPVTYKTVGSSMNARCENGYAEFKLFCQQNGILEPQINGKKVNMTDVCSQICSERERTLFLERSAFTNKVKSEPRSVEPLQSDREAEPVCYVRSGWKFRSINRSSCAEAPKHQFGIKEKELAHCKNARSGEICQFGCVMYMKQIGQFVCFNGIWISTHDPVCTIASYARGVIALILGVLVYVGIYRFTLDRDILIIE
ncbi:hypothetical protein MHBO_001268 [Bonamia ostreae]|uniref:Uncharacterized protein n=1 Tax=Bonamia ostreae TaxID=126728 RepID=A0ABV2AIB6_9EUKA